CSFSRTPLYTRCVPGPAGYSAKGLFMNMNRSWMSILAAAALASAAVSASQAASWQIGPFVRPPGAAPVITPNKDSVFRNPVDGKMVHWEALHTFNPAAIVRNGKIYVIYRAEDDTGEMAIGGATSPLGAPRTQNGAPLSPP